MSSKFLHIQLCCAKQWMLEDGKVFFETFKQFMRFLSSEIGSFWVNMLLIPDCIFKAVFCPKFSLRNILWMWCDKLVLKLSGKYEFKGY